MKLTHNNIIGKLSEIGTAHKDINTHYRWNFEEFAAILRENTALPLMTYESPTLAAANAESNLHLDYNCAFNILGKQGVATYEIDNEAAQNEVLTYCLEIALEVMRKLMADTSIPFVNDLPNSWYSVLDTLSFTFTKLGPVTQESLYGYRCEFNLNPKFYKAIDPTKWNS
jgi:hypothetical protein